MEPEGSLPYSQVPTTNSPRLPVWIFRNNIGFYGEELLAPCLNPKLEYNPLSAVRDCLLNIFASTLHIEGRCSIRNLRTSHAVVTGTNLWRVRKRFRSKLVSFQTHTNLLYELFYQRTLMHNFLYSLIICLLHYYPRHVSSINMPIFRRKNCIHTASGIFALCKRLHSTPVESGLQVMFCFILRPAYLDHTESSSGRNS